MHYSGIIIAFLCLTAIAKAAPLVSLSRIENNCTTWQVVEEDITDELKELALIHLPSQEKIIKQIENYRPKDISHLPAATRESSFLVDMSYTLPQDIKDGKGNILYPKGYRWNPLDFLPFSGSLLILDGSREQINWLMATSYAKNPAVRIFLAGGDAASLAEKLQRPVFYLTKGVAQRLHLKAAPSLVTKKEKRLLVEELVISQQNLEQKDERKKETAP